MKLPASLSLLALAAACSPAGGGPADTADDTAYEPAPYIVDDDSPPEASFSAEDVSAAITSAIAALPEITGKPVFPAYFAAMEGQSDGCPDYYEYNGNAYWYDYCTSAGGTSYEGYSFYYAYDGYVDDNGTVYDGDALSGVARVEDTQGQVFEAGGTAGAIHAVSSDGTIEYWQSVVQGSFTYDGPEARGTWMEEGIAPDLTQLVYLIPSTGGHGIQVDGGLADLPGDFPVVVFDNVLLFDAAIGGACPQEPGGVISVRDSTGNWYDVLLDGETDYGAGLDDQALCDGCGTAWFQGEQVGSVCVDFAAMNEWEGSPW